MLRARAALTPGLQSDGTLHDPVFGCPTQYGTAYYAWCCSVLPTASEADADESWRQRARRAFAAAVQHTRTRRRSPTPPGSTTGHSAWRPANDRDFTWPPIMKTLLGDPEPDHRLIDAVSGAGIAELFRTVPPSNWAAVWMSGEWLRINADLSTTTLKGSTAGSTSSSTGRTASGSTSTSVCTSSVGCPTPTTCSPVPTSPTCWRTAIAVGKWGECAASWRRACPESGHRALRRLRRLQLPQYGTDLGAGCPDHSLPCFGRTRPLARPRSRRPPGSRRGAPSDPSLSGSGRVGSSPPCRISWRPPCGSATRRTPPTGTTPRLRWPSWPARSLEDSGSSRIPAMRAGRKDCAGPR